MQISSLYCAFFFFFSEDNSRRRREITKHKQKLSVCPSRKVNHALAWETSKTMASHTMGCRVRLSGDSLKSDLRKRLHEVPDVEHHCTPVTTTEWFV
ncbi:hypothetical protein LINPERHAP1_LOCUS40665 [Linum perenne]